MNRKDYKKILAQRLAHCNDSIIKQSHGSSAHTQATPNDYESKTLQNIFTNFQIHFSVFNEPVRYYRKPLKRNLASQFITLDDHTKRRVSLAQHTQLSNEPSSKNSKDNTIVKQRQTDRRGTYDNHVSILGNDRHKQGMKNGQRQLTRAKSMRSIVTVGNMTKKGESLQRNCSRNGFNIGMNYQSVRRKTIACEQTQGNHIGCGGNLRQINHFRDKKVNLTMKSTLKRCQSFKI